MKKILIVYNPRSTRQAEMRWGVLDRLGEIKGYLIGKYLVKAVPVAENAQRLAKVIGEGDLVIVVGGDGTIMMAVNAIMMSGKVATLAALPYGNFNDLAGVLGGHGGVEAVVKKFQAGETQEVYPLEVKLDGRHWRYAMGYVTIGMFAAATEVFEEPKVRQRLQKSRHTRAYSILVLARWYVRQWGRRKKQYGCDLTLNGVELRGMSDYLAVNGPQVGGVMKGGEWYRDQAKFGCAVVKLVGLGKLLGFMLRSMVKGISLRESEGDEIEFGGEREMMIQTEGEAEKVKARKVEVEKAGSLRIVKI